MRYRMPLRGERVGVYRIGERLGAGGFGAVYKAERDGSPFALKFILGRELDGWGEREISILVRLRHPNVVRFVGCDRWPTEGSGYLYIAMEYVEGRTLEAWAREENPSARQVVEKLVPLVKALGDVHQQGVLHRDFKPENVIIRRADGEPILVDFGGGFFAGARALTAPGHVPGTPEYQSPQAMRAQAEGVSYRPGAADDFWALGVTLYWLLTDRLPFGTRKDGGLVKGILEHTPAPPHESNPRVPRALGELCQRMLEKAPEARFPDAEALGAALERLRSEADASWDVPLLDAFAPENATTVQVAKMADPEEDEVERELRRWERHQPRRGQKPAEKVAAPVQAPVAPAAPPVAPVAPPPASFFHFGARGLDMKGAALGAVLLALVLGAAVLVKRSEPVSDSVPGAVSTSFETLPTFQAGPVHEVEIPWKPSESAAGAEPREAQPPAPTETEMAHENDSSSKTAEKPAPKRKRRGLRSLVEKCVGAACCATLAGCSAPQVRPTPEPEACPPGAVETMKELGIEIGDGHPATFPVRRLGYLTVQEGFTSIMQIGPWGQLPDTTVFRGRLIVGEERVYGRLTEAETPGGKTFPVCFEVHDVEGGRGTVRESNGSAEKARVFSTVHVRSVDRFE